MATYQDIQKLVKARHSFSVKTCWIAHVKELNGLERRDSPNRHNPQSRVHPCPPDKRPMIEEAFRHFGML